MIYTFLVHDLTLIASLVLLFVLVVALARVGARAQNRFAKDSMAWMNAIRRNGMGGEGTEMPTPETFSPSTATLAICAALAGIVAGLSLLVHINLWVTAA